MNEEFNGDDNTQSEPSRALDAYDDQRNALAHGGVPTDYAELFTRLQGLIDGATEKIRELRQENAGLVTKVETLETRLRQQVAYATNDAQLQKAAERLQWELRPTADPKPRESESPAPALMRNTPPATNGVTPHLSEPSLPPEPMPVYVAPPPVSMPPVAPPPVMMEPVQMPEPPVFIAPAPEVVRSVELPAALPLEPLYIPTPPPAPEPEPVIVRSAPIPAAAMPQAAAVVLPSVTVAPPPSVPDKAAGTYSIVAYPFTRFSDLGQFQATLQELVGIHDVQVRRFAQGTLEMRIGYDGTVPLVQALRHVTGVENVEEEEPYRLRVRLNLNAI